MSHSATPFAPTSAGTFSNLSHVSAPLHEEVKLSSTTQEREIYENLSVIYSILVSLDYLEKAYVRDSISQQQYTPTCMRLLAQYQTILKSPQVMERFVSLKHFTQQYRLELPSATYRLEVGVPATTEHATSFQDSPAMFPSHTGTPTPAQQNVSLKLVADVTKDFINLMDALKINFRAKDQLHPLLADLIQSVNAMSNLNLEARGTIVKWLIRVNTLNGAGEQLSEAEVREMFFEIESAYNEFLQKLNS